VTAPEPRTFLPPTEAVRGWRVWHLVPSFGRIPGVDWVLAGLRGTVWESAVMVAECLPPHPTGSLHPSRAHLEHGPCLEPPVHKHCGIYAYSQRPNSLAEDGSILGEVLLWGRVLAGPLHNGQGDGYQASVCRIERLVAPLGLASARWNTYRGIADRLGVPIEQEAARETA
jgi:hypothetical protein